jgi:RNA polymerase sigma-70 factor, ECF subfamily
VSNAKPARNRVEVAAEVAAARTGDKTAFATLVERYRRELRVHCYRMLGSFEDSEDLVQETFLRAWRRRESFEGRSTLRAWLYRIATNACLDFLDRQPRTRQVASGANYSGAPPPAMIPWLQPYPDRLLEGIAPGDEEPEAAVVSRETMELAFLAAIQHLPPRQRAVLIVRDVLGWPAKDTAALLETSVASVNSALQRARPKLRDRLPQRRLEWTASSEPSEEERVVLERYMEALDRSDDDALGELLREDARCSQQSGAGGNMTPDSVWYQGRETLTEAWAPALRGPDAVEFRNVPVLVNMQPALASYIRVPGASEYRAFGIDVLRIEDGEVAEIAVFHPDLFPAFGLPETL